MAKNVLSPPPAGADIEVIVDWLELEALLSRFGVASLDDVISSQNLQTDDADTNIGDKDGAEEALRSSIEVELNFRSSALAASYPFKMSEDGEQVEYLLGDDLNGPAGIYLVCLILSHVTHSPILSVPPKPEMVRQARKRLFQIIATLAAAGHAGGGAVSLGWPREKKEKIINVVERAASLSGVGTARPAPHQLEPRSAKDGGLDVLAWKSAPDSPPAETFYFVQAASGHNWIEKSARNDYPQFLTCYFDTVPGCNHAFLTICPFRLPAKERNYHQISHGTISDRTRAPVMALAALEAAANGTTAIDEVHNLPVIGKWLTRYRRENRSVR